MRLAKRLLDALHRRGLRPGTDGYTRTALSWLNTHDPYGCGTLMKDADCIVFSLTDGSKLRLDLKTGTLTELQ